MRRLPGRLAGLALVALAATTAHAQGPVILTRTQPYFGCGTGDCYWVDVTRWEVASGSERLSEEGRLVGTVLAHRTAFDRVGLFATLAFFYDVPPGPAPAIELWGFQMDGGFPFGVWTAGRVPTVDLRLAWAADPANATFPGGAGWTVETVTLAAVPEPATVALTAGGLVALALGTRRRRRPGARRRSP
jgi:hypothetical protein